MSHQNKLLAMKAVYTYFFPEVRPIIKKVEQDIPDDMFFITTPVEKIRKGLEKMFSPPLEIPSIGGKVDVDSIHVPIIDRIVKVYREEVPALNRFFYKYSTANGSTEGIFHLLSQLRTKGIKEINVLRGEYEGYAAQCQNLGMRVKEIDDFDSAECSKQGWWFISNPSARDGNIIPNEKINELCDKGNKVIYDLAYVGATRKYEFDLSHENIRAAVMSFSKPYGVFRFRIGGFAFSREEVLTMYGNRWFKDTVRLFQALKLAETIGPRGLYDKYREWQKAIIRDLYIEFGVDLQDSDVLLIANLPGKKANDRQRKLLEDFKRADNYRLCLTPYFEMLEQKLKI